MNITTKTNKQMDTSAKNPSQTDKGTDRKNKPIQQPKQVKQTQQPKLLTGGYVEPGIFVCSNQKNKINIC